MAEQKKLGGITHYEWSEWCDKAEEGSNLPHGHKVNNAEWTFGPDHDGPATNEEALRMAREEGYAAALPEADRFAGHIAENVITDRLAVMYEARYDVVGGMVDMGRYMAGEPECMVEALPMRIASAGRAVRIVVPVCYSARTPSQTVLQRGAAVVALVDTLQRAQHPLEIWAVMAIHGHFKTSGRLVQSVCVQHANEPLDMGRIMFALAHPAMLRSLGFNVEDTFKQSIRKAFSIGHGYGTVPFDAAESDVPELDGTTIVLPPLKPDSDWSDEASTAWVKAQLDRIFRPEW